MGVEEDPSARVIAYLKAQGHFNPKHLANKSYIFRDKLEQRRLKPGVNKYGQRKDGWAHGSGLFWFHQNERPALSYMFVSVLDKEWQQTMKTAQKNARFQPVVTHEDFFEKIKWSFGYIYWWAVL